MATDPLLSDPLLSLRRAIAAQALPTPTTSSDVSNAADNLTDDLAKANHLYFTHPVPYTLPLNTLTRFVSTANNDTRVDLRSIFFAWQKKDVAIPEYIASAQEVNEALKQKKEKEGGQEEQVLNLVFVERLDLITWLEGASDDSEYIRPLEGAAAAAAAAADVTAPAVAADAVTAAAPKTTVPAAAGPGARPTKVIDPQLQEIYNGERKLGDRNTVLRGIKPTDFSHIRKTAEIFLGRNRGSRGQYPPGSNKGPSGKGGIVVPAPSAGLALPKKPGPSSGSSRRPDPIILLSPSASSPIRLSNIKTFLQDGVFVPPNHPTLASHTTSNMQIITRQTRIGIASGSQGGSGGAGGAAQTSKRPTRFILADSTANFKPDYWQRLVAVFTTGQAWQFKTYKWSNPPELFRHAAGIYVGMAGEHVPNQIKDWGRGVSTFTLARWDDKKGVDGAGRWLDREIVEHIWDVIENNMKAKGWTK
ncbi:Pol II transcription elongation factor subunit Cdc73, putative [Talaromyces stipitatus ATCC 10500]|uniref:Pol II transcription elongation factor subunit Cdc73, putative n=1 Tax=Talaromyces stipitatus (strain ATCC 10500 / CBS 375.48 / QM 6759 / NRRL 1006) TaxID=441959 RepID=B8M8X5_TALSN|nr:Pol II transcription elongation factor subunit Cdc73, putative [Talaromyces stipitatus ATCC 10500]EED20638.1 Pol II transcription elongation factor subunit Cdc73, putative [Talaromyces stipitatus ATCC 10500]